MRSAKGLTAAWHNMEKMPHNTLCIVTIGLVALDKLFCQAHSHALDAR